MSVKYGSAVAEIHRLILVYDSLPKDVQQEILRFLSSQGPNTYVNLRKPKKKDSKGPAVGTINLYVE